MHTEETVEIEKKKFSPKQVRKDNRKRKTIVFVAGYERGIGDCPKYRTAKYFLESHRVLLESRRVLLESQNSFQLLNGGCQNPKPYMPFKHDS